MNSKRALIMDLNHDIKCALTAKHFISQNPVACAYFNENKNAFLMCDGCRAGGRPIGCTCMQLMIEDIDERFKEIFDVTI